ncbi:retrovirus-related pol polyprotein from transposon TNT 1-94 [Tanacetum coccineum]
MCEERNPFTPRIRHFNFPRIRIPSHVKTYDGSGDPKDHLKLFQAATKTERESIESYGDLRTAFRENYLQQTKHIKDPVEIHHIKQRDVESTEDFMERYKAEILDVEGAPECMKISRFMHAGLLAADDAGKKVPNSFLSLLRLLNYPIRLKSGLSDAPSSKLCFLVLDRTTIGQLHLQSVVLSSFRGSENEVCLIKFILACSPLLKKIVIKVDQYYLDGRHDSALEMARKLLKLYRASPLGKGYDIGHEAEQKQVEIMEDRRDKVQAEYHVLELQPEEPLSELVFEAFEDHIMDSGASFHATYCKEELERFKLRSGKVCLADDKTLDIAGVGDVVLKTFFGTSWTLKDVRYIPGLKRSLILFGQLDEEGYHVGFGDQEWKVTKGSLVVAHANKCGSMYMVEIHPEGIDAIINGSGSAAVWFGEAEEAFIPNVREDKETTKTAAGVVFGVAERLSRTFRAESTGLRAEAPKMLWADSVKDVCGDAMKCTFIGSDSNEMRYSFRDTKSHQKSQVVLVDIPENLAENDNIVAELGLSSEITQSPGGSSDMSEGFENSGSLEIVEDHMKKTLKTEHPPRREAPRLHMYEDPLESPGLQKEGITKLVDVRLKKSMIAAKAQKRGFSASWAGIKPRVQIEGNFVRADSSTEATVLGYVLTVGVTTVEWESRLQKSITIFTKSLIHLVKNWAKLVRILISERSLSLLKILGTKSLAEMFTRLVMEEKLKFYAASTGLRVN